MIRGYVRVSSAEQVNGSSLATQRQQIAGYVQLKGGAGGLEIFEDGGVSGSTPLHDRPAGHRLLSTAARGDTIVVAKLDRLFRNAADALTTAQALEARGISLVLLDVSTDPVNAGGVGKLIFTVLAAVAEMERSRILERTEAGREAKKARGGHMGGAAPFGYRAVGSGKAAVLEPVPEEHQAILTMLQGKDAGLSLRKISQLVWMTHQIKISHVAVDRILKEQRHGNA